MWQHRLHIFGRKGLPLILQTETTECGLCCIAMIAGYYGYKTDLSSLRRRYPQSMNGQTVKSLISLAADLNLAARPLKLELEELGSLKVPCILHWNLNHFVVLQRFSKNSASIYDPARGARVMSLNEISRSFTGVAIEFWPTQSFKEADEQKRIGIGTLLGPISGLKRSLLMIIVLALGLEVCGIIAPLYIQWVIDYVLIAADESLLDILAIGFFLLLLIQQLLSVARSWSSIYLNTSLSVQWKGNVFLHLIRLPVTYFEKRHVGDVVSRFGATDAIQATITASFVSGTLDGIMAVLTLTLMFIYSPLITLVPVITMLIYAGGRAVRYRPLRLGTEEETIHGAKQSSHFLESVRGIKAIKLFGAYGTRANGWMSHLSDQINAGLKVQKLGITYHTLNSLLFGIEGIVVVWLGAHSVMSGQISTGALIAYLAYKQQFDARVGALVDRIFEIRLLRVPVERLSDILLADTEMDRSDVPFLESRQEHGTSITLNNIFFRYSSNDPFVIENASIHIAPGESVAICGPSGAGKSTLLSLIVGINTPTSGSIEISGVLVNTLGIQTVRSMIGTVLQDDTLFAGTIADNISFFDSDADDEWIRKCAHLAVIDSEIGAMPMGYNTFIGDMGGALSGGQRQRLLIARALYKRPNILLMDEATSSLDIANEKQVSENIRSLKITRIIVAHRPETINSADRVLTLSSEGLF